MFQHHHKDTQINDAEESESEKETRRERWRGKFEDLILLALKVMDGTISQGVQATPRSWGRREFRFPQQLAKEM